MSIALPATPQASCPPFAASAALSPAVDAARSPAPPRRWLRHGMLPQIAAFEAVVRHGSATRAADALCIAQPTLSGHLRKLGEALGVRLFEQQGKRLVPTPEARVLLAAAHEVFGALERCERALAAARSAAGTPVGTARAATIPGP